MVLQSRRLAAIIGHERRNDISDINDVNAAVAGRRTPDGLPASWPAAHCRLVRLPYCCASFSRSFVAGWLPASSSSTLANITHGRRSAHTFRRRHCCTYTLTIAGWQSKKNARLVCWAARVSRVRATRCVYRYRRVRETRRTLAVCMLAHVHGRRRGRLAFRCQWSRAFSDSNLSKQLRERISFFAREDNAALFGGGIEAHTHTRTQAS